MGGTKRNIMEYLFVCSTIDIQMKNHLHCYRYQRMKYFLLCFTKSSHLLATPSLELGGRLLLVSGHWLKEKALLCLD